MASYQDIKGYSWLGGASNLTYSLNPSTHSSIFALAAGFDSIDWGDGLLAGSVMGAWENVANINFSVNNSNPDIGFFEAEHSNTDLLGRTKMFLNTPWFSDVDVYINKNYNFSSGEKAFTYLHELGHALGLTHPEGGDGYSISYDNRTTVMSYNEVGEFPITPMIYDIQAVQNMYGTNTSYNSSNTTYTLTGNQKLWTIWDGGGDDFLEVDINETRNLSLDLREGFDSFGVQYLTQIGNERVFLAYGANIEIASGGKGNDKLYGNDKKTTAAEKANDPAGAADYNGENTLIGNGGDDKLFGLSGDDKLFGDSLNPENTTIIGNDSLDGGDGGDSLYGGIGRDTLDGGVGDGIADRLEGGAGYDTYIFETTGGKDVVYDSDGFGVLEVKSSGGDFTLSGVATNVSPGNFMLGSAELTWTGDLAVAGSKGMLTINYDPGALSNEPDIIIENFASQNLRIVLEGALHEDGSVGNDTTPGGQGDLVFYTAPPEGGDHIWVEGQHNSSGGGFAIYEMRLTSSYNYTPPEEDAPTLADKLPGDGLQLYTMYPYPGGSGSPYEFVYLADSEDAVTYGDGSDGSFGEPHLATFDGLLYDFQDGGEFTLIESTDSNDFTVQVRQKTWDLGDAVGDKFAVNSAVATEFGSTKVGLYIEGSLPWDTSLWGLDQSPFTDVIPVLYIDDAPIILPSSGILFIEDGFVYRNGDRYTLVNGHGDGFTATVHDEYIDISTFLSTNRAAGTIEGLLGNYDGDAGNDIALADGTVLGDSITSYMLYDIFGEDWRITQTESLFLYGTGETTSSFDYTGFDNSYLTLDDFTTAQVTTASASAISAGFDANSDIFDAIVMDFLILGDVELTQQLQDFEAASYQIADISDDVSSNLIMGTVNGDYIVGTANADHIVAMAGNDTVYGRADADIIIGGLGDDSLYGEGGGDTYLHYIGDGNDYILSLGGDLSTVTMSGVAAEDIYFNVNGYNLFATDINTGETLELANQYYQIASGFNIGTVNGINVTNSLHVRGSSATAGEVIYGTIGNGDTIEGGLGDDTLYSNGGSDSFVYNIGDGADEFHALLGSLSTIDMVGVSTDDIRLRVDGYNLEIINDVTGEIITLYQQLYQTTYGYRFDNVNGINLKNGLVIDGTDAGEVINGTIGYADTITGGLGDDTIHGNGGADVIMLNLGDGNDLLKANLNDQVTILLTGISNDDLRFNVNGYNLEITNTINSDVITLQNQLYQTSYGYDFASINGIDLTTGLTIEGGSNGDTLYGTADADSILGGAGADVLHGGLGDDTLIGGLDNDTVYGEGGTDIFIHGIGDGNDQLFENYGALAIVTMNGVVNSDIYFTVDGYHLYATNINNGEQLTLNDQYYFTNYGYRFGTLNGMDITGGLTIKGTSSTLGEHIKGTTGADTLIGGAGNDTIEGRDGLDLFVHNVGDANDVLYSWNGAQASIQMNGVAANDIRLSVSGNNVIITDDATGETLTLINQLYQTNYGYKFASVNGINLMGGIAINGTGAAEVIYGTTGIDTLTGGLGDDTLYGQGAADSFIHEAGDGSDTLYANNNNLATVTMNGVVSSDLLFSANGYNLVVTDTATNESLTLYNQYYQTTSGYKFDSFNGINIATEFTSTGTDNADVINGSAQNNTISGGLGNDTLDGQGGNDTLNGQAGNDELFGYTGNDFLYGNAGNDLLDGQWGNDTLNGGAGDDTLTGSSNFDYFVFTGSDSGNDVITDFYAYYDQLQFDSSIFATPADAVAAFSSGVIDLGGGNSVTLTGITTLSEADVEII